MEILKFIITTSGITGILIWLGKLIITKVFDAGAEEHKTKLSKDVEQYKNDLLKKTEVHKAALIQLNQENLIRFTKLHDERAEKIKLLFSQVIALEDSLKAATYLAQSDYLTDTERDGKCIENLKVLTSSVNKEQILFSPDLIKKFDAIFNESAKIITDMTIARDKAQQFDHHIEQNIPVPKEFFGSSELWLESYKRTEIEFKTLKDNLANEFRSLLGISNN